MSGAEQAVPSAGLGNETPESYAFVANIAGLPPGGPHILAPGHELRRASSEEIAVIRETALPLLPGPRAIYQHLWERRWPPERGLVEVLPEAEWRYFVIAFTGSNVTVSDLEAAFDLTPLELEVVLTFLLTDLGGGRRGIVWHGSRLFQVLQPAPFDMGFFREVLPGDLEAVRDIYSRLHAHDRGVIDVRRLAAQLGDLKTLPHQSPLCFLGYFAILESLLTHRPKPTDPYESMTRQVKKKMALLDGRWSPRLDYRAFGDTKPETLWAKMYTYRSILAHGGTPSFTGELAVLRSHDDAVRLIREATKAVIRHALREPQLIVDLREC